MSEFTLEQLNDENVFIQFDPDCIRKRSNLSKSSDHYKFDNKEFEIIDLHPSFLNNSGSMNRNFSRDGVHLNENGYKVWIEKLMPYVESFK